MVVITFYCTHLRASGQESHLCKIKILLEGGFFVQYQPITHCLSVAEEKMYEGNFDVSYRLHKKITLVTDLSIILSVIPPLTEKFIIIIII